MHRVMWLAIVLSNTLFGSGQVGSNVTPQAMRRVVVKRTVEKILPAYVPRLSAIMTDYLLRGFVATTVPRYRISFPMTLTLAGKVRYIAERERLKAFLNYEYENSSAYTIQYLLRREGKPLLIPRTGRILSIGTEFSWTKTEERSLIALLDNGNIVIQQVKNGEEVGKISPTATRIYADMILPDEVVTPEALTLALSNTKEEHDDLLAYIYNRSADEDAVRWQDLADERTIYSELASFIASTVDADQQDKLLEKEFKEIIEDNYAIFARWLRKEALLEYVARLIDKRPFSPDYSQHYSLDNLPDTPEAWLDGRSRREVMATALAARHK